MSKKIKITENQLKMIFERKHTYKQETNEEEFENIDQLEDDDKEEIKVGEQSEEWNPNGSVAVSGVSADAARGSGPMWESKEDIIKNFKRFM
jgi:hypothetical protein